MAGKDLRELFAGMSNRGLSLLASLQSLAPRIQQRIAGASSNKVDWDADFLDLLDQIDGLTSDPQKLGDGPQVAPEDAAQTGSLFRLDGQGDAIRITLRAALDHMVAGELLLIGGADASIATFIDDASQVLYATKGTGIVAQYVGIDMSHWNVTDAVAILEPNFVATAVMQMVNAALNQKNVASVVMSYSFATWVVNRALQVLEPQTVAGAKNLQIDGFGPLDVMQELDAVKSGNFGKICNVQTLWGTTNVAPQFGVTADALKKLPLDIAG